VPPEIVDDACAFAWQQFLQHQPDRDRNWRAWLVTMAEREAWRLAASRRATRRCRSTSRARRSRRRGHRRRPTSGSDSLAAPRPLEALARLPDRRREIKALQMTGFSYDEIAEMRGLTYTRVDHILAEAARAAAPEGEGEGEAAGRLECRWQREQLPESIREVVLDDQRLAAGGLGVEPFAHAALTGPRASRQLTGTERAPARAR
jgi:DNA-directed RNA polymerase specialized sigma24 family protein